MRIEAITAPAIAALSDPALSDHEHGRGVTIALVSWVRPMPSGKQ